MCVLKIPKIRKYIRNSTTQTNRYSKNTKLNHQELAAAQSYLTKQESNLDDLIVFIDFANRQKFHKGGRMFGRMLKLILISFACGQILKTTVVAVSCGWCQKSPLASLFCCYFYIFWSFGTIEFNTDFEKMSSARPGTRRRGRWTNCHYLP